MRILAVIPARGGSKGVPRKNIRLIAGKPLIAYTIDVALGASDLIYRTVVSTEDEEIAAIAQQLGANVPFMRPTELAEDDSPTLPVLLHATEFAERDTGEHFDWVLTLQPTALFREVDDVRNAISIASRTDADSVISVVQVFAEHPVLMKRIEDDYLVPFCVEEQEGTRRQDYYPPAYIRNGAIYLTRRATLVNDRSIWGKRVAPYVMPPDRSVNIDSELDMLVAETILRKRYDSDS